MTHPTFDAAERRARIGMRHRLGVEARAETVEEIAASVVAIHSTDPASVVVASWARLADRGATAAEVERALYEDRTLLRLMGMRRTMFVVDREVAPVMQAACGLAVEARERKRTLGYLTASGVGGKQPERWLARAQDAALAALRERGEATAVEVAAADELLSTEIVVGSGKWTAPQKVASRVLLLLALQGRAVRARPRGGWSSTQFRWAAFDAWAGEPLEEVEPGAARAALARRWLHAYGPARAADLQWWTGWTAGQTKQALAADDVVDVALEDGADGVVLGDDLDPVGDVGPWVALLPALDATPMGFKHRDFYLGAHAERLFDVNGNVSPTVWADGRIVGGWARRADGEIAYTLLEDLGSEATAAIAAEASALSPRLGDATLAPRARGYSPVERELLDII